MLYLFLKLFGLHHSEPLHPAPLITVITVFTLVACFGACSAACEREIVTNGTLSDEYRMSMKLTRYVTNSLKSQVFGRRGPYKLHTVQHSRDRGHAFCSRTLSHCLAALIERGEGSV